MFFDDSIKGIIRKDLYLSILLNFNNVPSNYPICLMKNFYITKLDINNIYGEINVQTLIAYITSHIALSAYRNVFINQGLEQFYDVNNLTEKDKETYFNSIIESTLVSFISKANLYRANLLEGLAKMICFGLNIIINKVMFKWDNTIVASAYIFYIILYELSHCMIRLIRRKKEEPDYFNDTKSTGDCCESGEYSDLVLFNGNKTFTEIDSIYLMNINN